ncbi:hypothetical protein BJF83_14155 [Nocardiopsis sp. CNR-923]|nr:hypothetical protein BJF83_14155 [Nocardiopsis sp. CNR-923]
MPSRIRGPVAHRYGLTVNQNSSTRPWAIRSRASSPAAGWTMSPSCSSLSALTASARSPSSRVAFHSSGARSVRDATYLGMPFIRAAYAPNPGTPASSGHTVDRPS